MDSHNYSFFGQKTGLLIGTPSRSDTKVYFRFIRKKENGTWEKPKNGEGRVVKFGILELINILEVLRGRMEQWSTVHKFNGDMTTIRVKRMGDACMIGINEYSKSLSKPEIILLSDLLTHIYKEKIEYATGSEKPNTDRTERRNTSRQSAMDVNITNEGEDEGNQKYKSEKSDFEGDILVDEILNTPPKNIPNKMAMAKNEFSSKHKSDSAYTSPSPTKREASTLFTDQREWLNNLAYNEDFVFLPGAVLKQKDKAISFRVDGLNSIWLPISQLRDVDLCDELGGIWVKKWVVVKKLEDIFNIKSVA